MALLSGMGRGEARPCATFGELLVFLIGEGELWLSLLKGELFASLFCLERTSLLRRAEVGSLNGDGELLPLLAGEGELLRLAVGIGSLLEAVEGELLLLEPSLSCRVELLEANSFFVVDTMPLSPEEFLFIEDTFLLEETSSVLRREGSFLFLGDWTSLPEDLTSRMGDLYLLFGDWSPLEVLWWSRRL